MLQLRAIHMLAPEADCIRESTTKVSG